MNPSKCCKHWGENSNNQYVCLCSGNCHATDTADNTAERHHLRNILRQQPDEKPILEFSDTAEKKCPCGGYNKFTHIEDCPTTDTSDWRKEAARLITQCHSSLEPEEMEESRDEMLAFIANELEKARSDGYADGAQIHQNSFEAGRAEERASLREVIKGKMVGGTTNYWIGHDRALDDLLDTLKD